MVLLCLNQEDRNTQAPVSKLNNLSPRVLLKYSIYIIKISSIWCKTSNKKITLQAVPVKYYSKRPIYNFIVKKKVLMKLHCPSSQTE